MKTTKKHSRPGPKGHAVLGMALPFQKDPLALFDQLAKDFPSISFFRFAHMPIVNVADPELIKHVLATNNKAYKKGVEYKHLEHTLGEGLLTSEGDFWLRQRRLAQPAFHKKRIVHFLDTMTESTSDLLENWNHTQPGETVDILPEMMRLTLDIVARTMFGTNVVGKAGDVEKALGVVIEDAYTRISSLIPIPLWIPTPSNVATKAQIKVLDDVILGVVDHRRQNPGAHHDLLAMLMEARDEETGESMTDKHLRDECMTIFLAGHETTANALTWALYLLSQNPLQEALFHAEIDEVLKGEVPTLEHTRMMPYTLQVIKEAMRLYPPAWALGRTAVTEDMIDGHPIRKGDNVIICPWSVHRSAALWEDPLSFKPERFAPEKEKEMHKFQYFPFGGGPRLCIGFNFALLEMQVALAMIGQHYRPRLKEGHPVELEPLVTLRAKHGMQMILEKR